MHFRIAGLAPAPLQSLFGLPDAELARRGVRRYVADQTPGFPCRVEMREGRPGETFLLLNHLCQPADTPYRTTHAIYVREGAETVYDAVDEVPEVMRVRPLSLRAFDASGMMLDADVVAGTEVEPVIARLLSNPAVRYVHVHNAKRGCYSGRIDRTL